MAIFFASRVLPEVGVHLSLWCYLVIGLTAYNSVVIAEIIRAGVQTLPRGQTEAAYAIGLTRGATLRLILLPQAFRVMLPALISQLALRRLATDDGVPASVVADFVVTLLLDGLRPRKEKKR